MTGSEIADGVWQLKLPLRYNPLGYTFSYYISDISTLIDAGEESDEARLALERQLAKSGHRISDIERVILTHLHRDHVGLVDHVKSASNAEICAHKIAQERSENPLNGENLYDDMRKELKMFGGSDLLSLFSRFESSFRRSFAPIRIDRGYDDGDQIAFGESKIRVIWTPGHAPEHICLHEEKGRVLYSGDHVLPVITPHVSLHTHEKGDPLRDYLGSLEKVRQLEVERVLPAHEFVFSDLKSRIEELRRHHDLRVNEIMTALGEGEKTVFQVSSKISWKSRPWPLMPFWVKRMAAAETYAHLVFLRNKGEVRERGADGVLYYRKI